MSNAAAPRGTITPLVTPFRLGTVDQRQLAVLVDRQVFSGIDGIVVCDPTGEGSCLSEHERDDVIWATVAATRNRIPVIAATGTNCTSRTIDLTLRSAELGAKAALVTVPYYSKPGDRGIVHHFQQVATRTGIPIIIDDDPDRTASRLSVPILAELAGIPNIVGVRHCSGDVAAFHAMPPDLKNRFVHYGGDDQTAFSFLMAGGSAIISPTANLVPQLVSSLQKAAVATNLSAAHSISQRLFPLISALGQIGPPSVKHALVLLTGSNPEVRLPLSAVERKEADAIAAALAPYFAPESAFRLKRHLQIWG
jgi:4-hydroxy-tetrahydrodipicolinate synthase